MAIFTPNELAFIANQRLGRFATVNAQLQPQIAPITFRFNPDEETFDIGGRNLSNSQKFRNVLRHPQVSLVMDEVLPPWQPRGIEIRGIAQARTSGGQAIVAQSVAEEWNDAFIRIFPQRIISWGLDTSGFDVRGRSVDVDPARFGQ